MNVSEHLIVTARLFPNREAIVFEEQRLTYQQVERQSCEAAAWLRSSGVQPGDRVGLWLPNVPAFVIWYYAILRLGAVAVSISTRLAARESAFILSDCQARILIADADALQSLADEQPECVAGTIATDDLGQTCNQSSLADYPGDPAEGRASTDPDDPALILYTSGTTGFAKGATLSHQNVRATVHAFNHLCQMRSDDRILLAVPLFHCYGQNALLNSGFNVGATMVLQRRFDLNESRRLIREERVNRLFGVPTTFQLLEECCDPSDLQSVEYCFSAAATLPIQLSRRWQKKFSMPIYEGYGLTETAPFASYNHRLKFVPGSIGTPVDLCEMKIVDTESGEACPPGELGEIAIRGPNVMLGYWNRPEDTAHAIRDGWFHSGDIGRMDDDGYYYIVDRVKDMIVIGGLKVYPAEVERVMLDHPAVCEVAVVGFPDEVFGEKVVAFLVAKDDRDPNTADEIRRHCQSCLADFKVPRVIEFVKDLPRNPAGKVLKTRLRAMELTGQELSGIPSDAVAADQTDAWQGIESPIPVMPGDQGPWINKLLAIHPTGRGRQLTTLIQQQVQEITQSEIFPEPEERFIETGLDSLMIVDLRDRLQTNIGSLLELPTTLVFDYPRICDLADFLTESLELEKPAAGDRPHKVPEQDPGKERELAEQIQSMSEEQALQELMREINQ